MVGMVHDAFGIPNIDDAETGNSSESTQVFGPNEETKSFFNLIKDAEQPLYPGCEKFTQLSFIVRMLSFKVMSGWTDKSFTLLLELLIEAFPEGVRLPNSYYKANKMTTDLDFTYKTWDACPNHCMLFKNENKDIGECVICHASRYKEDDSNDPNTSKNTIANKNGGKRVAAKQVRYFPLKARLKRLFMSSKTSSLVTWHVKERIDDGVLRHPADSQAWKAFDTKNSSFASEIRNVRLGLATDGFNIFRNMSLVHSTWPVVLMCYNLPPWLFMKQPFFILSTLIDGKYGPGDKLDVFMQPLIEELKELWNEGVFTYDASTNEMFKLHAALLWTISDFPAYAYLSGWSTKGKFACPCSNI
ncbi:hypothetical protein Scep_028013 [Stephania cephalantha]|uniref:Transposase n=1 Tax=Stephania cephalantha TaxID=152367 RepID=A0AAP0E953_9MAGN